MGRWRTLALFGATLLAVGACRKTTDLPFPTTPVTNFTALGGYQAITLNWRRPANPEVTDVVIRVDVDGYPVSITDGSEVYTGTEETFTEVGLLSGTAYYYSAFTVTEAGDASPPVTVDTSTIPGGMPDIQFGGVGVIFEDDATVTDEARGIYAHSNGTVYTAGATSNGADFDLVLWRHTEAGVSAAAPIVVNDGGNDFGTAIALRPSTGALAVAGRSEIGALGYEASVWVFDGGSVTKGSDGTSGTDGAEDVAVDATGRIVLAGDSIPAVDRNMTVWRFTGAGVIDPAFNGGAFSTDGLTAGANSSGNAIAIDPQGRIVVAGYSENGNGDEDIVVWRILDTGLIDTSFGVNGVAVYDSGGDESAAGIAIDVNDDILVVGGLETGVVGGRDLVVLRFTDQGFLDTTFGSNGVVQIARTGLLAGDESGEDLVLDDFGRIVVTGFVTTPATGKDMLLARLDNLGNMDSTFGVGGIRVYDEAGFADEGFAVTLDNQGRILVGGRSMDDASFRMAAWRILP